jgi:DNA-binding transcriptional ArsR family regulator
MVKHSMHLNTVFQALSDPTRRDILERVAVREWSVGELVELYDMSFAAVSKHIAVLERAKLIAKRKEGRSYFVSLQPSTVKEADAYLERYRRMWEGRYKKLDSLLNN